MEYQKIDGQFLESLKAILGEERVFLDEETRVAYGRDETEDLCFPPDVLVKPKTTEEVSKIMKLCSKHKVPVTPIGARTGLSGGALSVLGGVGMSLEKLNQVIKVDENNFQVVVEPGVVTQELQELLQEKGLYYPPDPSSRGSCFIGGNVAENAGGPRAVKYGCTKDYVLNLEVVLPNGDVIWTGANTIKNATGYNLTQLLVGSEGTLGIITKIVLRLVPYPKHQLLLLVPFYVEEEACEAVSEIFKAGVTPSTLEFMEREAIDWVQRFDPTIQVEVDQKVKAHLLIEVDGNHKEALYEEIEVVNTVVASYDIGEVLFAEDSAQKDILWRMRRRVAEAVKGNTIYKEEDTVVPRYALPKLLKGVKDIGRKYGFQSVCYGHAGDGNLHINVIKGNLTDEQWNTTVVDGVRDIFELTVLLGGTLSGEHGIGFVQKDFMPIAFNKTQLKIFQMIKELFDPSKILNPGKII